MLPTFKSSPRGSTTQVTQAILRDELKSFARCEFRDEVADALRTSLSQHFNQLAGLMSSLHGGVVELPRESVMGPQPSRRDNGNSVYSLLPVDHMDSIAYAGDDERQEVRRMRATYSETEFAADGCASGPVHVQEESHEWMTRHVRANKMRATGLMMNEEQRRLSQLSQAAEVKPKESATPNSAENSPLGAASKTPLKETPEKHRDKEKHRDSKVEDPRYRPRREEIDVVERLIDFRVGGVDQPINLKESDQYVNRKEPAPRGALAGHPVLLPSDAEPSPRTPTVTCPDPAYDKQLYRPHTRIAREETLAAEHAPLLKEETAAYVEIEKFGPPPSQRRRKDQTTTWRAQAEAFMGTWQFDCSVGILIVLNAVAIGNETDYRAARVEQEESLVLPPELETTELIFAILFGLELSIRLWVQGCNFFFGPGWTWNVFDFAIIALQVLDQMLHTFTWISIGTTNNFSFLRLLRIMRLIRITRLIRVLRLIEELRTIVASIMGSLRSLVWTLVLLVIMIYTASVCFTQVVLDAGHTEHREDLHCWFGRLGRTVLTMFECISGGLSWDVVVVPLVTDISPLLGILFCFYVAFCVLAMMNVVTGVFVQKAIQGGQEDKDNYLANHISDLFFREKDGCGGSPGSGTINWEEFESRLNAADMQDYFKEMNVDVSEARGLFRLLDVNNSGTVDVEEVVNGCLRLRGPAKALEMHLLLHESTRLRQRMMSHQKFVEATLQYLKSTIKAMVIQSNDAKYTALRLTTNAGVDVDKDTISDAGSKS